MADKKNEPEATQLSRVGLVKKAASRAMSALESTEGELSALSAQFGVPAIDLSRIRLDLTLLQWLPKATATQHMMIPVSLAGDQISVAMADPGNVKAVEEFEFVTGKDLVILVASRAAVESLIKQAYQAERDGEAWYVGSRYARDSGATAVQDDARGSEKPSRQADAPQRSIPALSRGERDEEAVALQIGSGAQQLLELDERAVDNPAEAAPLDGVALVVEDDEAIRALVGVHLRRMGLTVVEACDGQEAMDYLANAVPDLAVVDAMLPRVHGFEVVRRMRSDPNLQSVEIIVLTAVHRGWRFAEDLRTVSGVRHYIEKPFQAAVLTRAVRELLGNSPVSQRDAAGFAQLEQGVQLLKSGKTKEAVELFRTGIAEAPDAYLLHYHLGLALERLGQTFEAIGAIERAVALCPRYFVGVKNLAVLYHRAGFQNKSTEMWERALALAPEEKTRDAIRSHLLRLF